MDQIVNGFKDLHFEQEEIFSFFNASPIGVYIIHDGRFVFNNTRFQETTGYTGGELRQTAPQELVLPEDRELVRECAVGMLKGSRKDPYQYRCMTKRGETCWILETVTSMSHLGKRALLGYFMDITESKHNEKALHESEKKYRSFFNLAREGIAVVDHADGNILDFNDEFIRLTNFGPEDFRRKKIWEIQPSSFQQEARETFLRFAETDGGIVSWKLCQKRDGVIPVEIVAQRLTVDGGDVIYCMIRDISEREAMMRALKLASEEWRKCFDAIDDAVLIVDSDFKICRANRAAARLVEMDVAHHLNGKECYKLVHGTNSPPDYCPRLNTEEDNTTSRDVEVNEPHLGRILRFCCSPMKNGQEEKKLGVEIISDLTARRSHEQESMRLNGDLAASFEGITGALSDLIEIRDPYTAGHSRHVAEFALLIAEELGFNEEDLRGLHTCALLHDIGKATIPSGILNKPGKLSEHEWGLIKAHPADAFETIRHVPFPWPVARVVYQHHERLDGSGYPQGLQGKEIHLWAGIIAVADVYDAMTSHRPYRPQLPRQQAIDELEKGRGLRYDAKIVDTLVGLVRKRDKRVLVVDKDADNLSTIVQEFEAQGLDTSGFQEPESALRAFAIDPFPLAIVEFKLHSMDGAQLTRKLRDISPESEVIMITEGVDKTEALKALRAGAADFLEKPVNLEMLLTSVRSSLQRFSSRAMHKHSIPQVWA